MFISDPANPVPTAPARGKKFIAQFMPFDQQLLHTRQDVLVYTTPPLEDPLQFAGHVRAELFVSTDYPGANVVVKLLDLHPDGFAHTLRDGALYLHVNETRLPHELLQPGAVRHVTIDMGHAAARIDRGHRLCVQVAGTNAPLHNALIGEEYGISSSQVMTQKVYHSRKHPSRVLLPLLKKGDGQ
jgi:putative CocE/NonD family hydrolase